MNTLYDMLPVVGQNAACTLAGVYRAYTRHPRIFHRRLAELKRTRDLPLDELYQLQWEQLQKMVSRAQTYVPHYRDLPECSSASDPSVAIRETLDRMPLLTKEVYRENAQSFISADIPKRSILRGRTSGTTGTALPLYASARTVAEEYATVWRLRDAHGVDLQDSHLTFNGQLIVPVKQTKPPYWRNNMYQRQILFSIYHMTTRNLGDYVGAIHDLEFSYVDGYPSALYQAARAMLEQGRPLEKGRMKAIFTSSESLLAYQRETIEEAFGASVWDRYGTAEFAVSMTACSEKNLHVDMEFGIVEVDVLEETDEYVRGPLVVTGFANDVTPFIRYRIGDYGTRLKGECPCGRAGDVFSDVDGRSDDFVITPDGRKIGRLDHIFKDQTTVVEAQIRQTTRESINIIFVPDRRFGPKEEKGLLQEVRSRLGDEIEIRLLPVESIPREANGKFRAVKSVAT